MRKWCDLSCTHASWPEEEGLDGSNSCRTFLAIYCAKLERLVDKNGPCLAVARSKKRTEGPKTN